MPRRHGRPVGILVGVANEDDWLDYRLEHDSRFLGLIASAGASIQAGSIPSNPRHAPHTRNVIRQSLTLFFETNFAHVLVGGTLPFPA